MAKQGTGAEARGINSTKDSRLRDRRRSKPESALLRNAKYVPAFSARLRALLDTPVQLDESAELELPMLTLSNDARAIWVRFHDDVESELRPGGDMAEARDVASKAADNVARMAALFHVFKHGPSGQVGAEAVTSAARIVGWHLFQARAFLGDVAAAPRELSNARRLDAW